MQIKSCSDDNVVLHVPPELPVRVTELADYFDLDVAGIHLKTVCGSTHAAIYPENGCFTLNPDADITYVIGMTRGNSNSNTNNNNNTANNIENVNSSDTYRSTNNYSNYSRRSAPPSWGLGYNTQHQTVG